MSKEFVRETNNAMPLDINYAINVPELIEKITNLSKKHSLKLHSDEPQTKLPPNAFSYLSSTSQKAKNSTNQSKIPNRIPINDTNKNIIKCYICYQNAAEIFLSCLHVFCAFCLSETICQLDNAICPFQMKNSKCNYKLNADDLQHITNALETSLIEMCESQTNIASKPIVVNKIHDSSDGMIVNCNEYKCEGWWFVDKNEHKSKYQCGVCGRYSNNLTEDTFSQAVSNESTWICEFCTYSDNTMDFNTCALCSKTKKSSYQNDKVGFNNFLRVGKIQINPEYECCMANCQGCWLFQEGTYDYKCPMCQTVNCITCRSSHPYIDCNTYQESVLYFSDKTGTESKLKLMLKSGDADYCPKCNIVVAKNGPQMRCSMCRINFV